MRNSFINLLSKPTASIIPALLLSLLSSTATAEVMQFFPSKDNTLYEDATGSSSNGSGTQLFIGRTGVNAGLRVRRTLIQFDLSALPEGSTIESVSVTLVVNQAAPGAQPFTAILHRVLDDW